MSIHIYMYVFRCVYIYIYMLDGEAAGPSFELAWGRSRTTASPEDEAISPNSEYDMSHGPNSLKEAQ